MSLQKPALIFKAEKPFIFSNNKDFLLITQGRGIKCQTCQSKIFFGFINWKNHCKTKKHIHRHINNDKKISTNNELEKLKEELKLEKIDKCRYANHCEQLKNQLKELRREFIIIKQEIKKKFNLK